MRLGFGTMYPMADRGRPKGRRSLPEAMTGASVWERLEALIEACDAGNQAEFARKIKFSPQQVNDYRAGRRVPSHAMQVGIVVAYAVDFDWLLRGNDTGLAPELKQRLANARRKLGKSRLT